MVYSDDGYREGAAQLFTHAYRLHPCGVFALNYVPRRDDNSTLVQTVICVAFLSGTDLWGNPSHASCKNVGGLNHNLRFRIHISHVSEDFPLVAGLVSKAMMERGLLRRAFVFVGPIVEFYVKPSELFKVSLAARKAQQMLEDEFLKTQVSIAVAEFLMVRMAHLHDHASKPPLSAPDEMEDFIDEIIELTRRVTAPRVFRVPL